MTLALLCGAGISVAAQSAYFSGMTRQLPSGSGFFEASGTAVDSSGNIFLADAGNNAIKKIPLVDGVYQTPVLLPGGSGSSSTYNAPVGVAVDRSGNVFVADTGNNLIREIRFSAGTYQAPVSIGGSFSHPDGLAVDGSGNVFVADTVDGSVAEISAAGPFATTRILASSLNVPVAVAVDAKGNVFVADYGDSKVWEVMAVDGSVPPSPTINSLGSGFFHPEGVAVDINGNVYISDSHNSQVKEMLAVDGSIPLSSPTILTLGSGFSLPLGMAADPSGNLFIGDYTNSAVYEIATGGVNFGSLPVATATPVTEALQFTFTTGGTIQAPKVTTQGALGLDYSDAGTGTCTTNGASHLYASSDSCTVDVTLRPELAGTRYGGVQLLNSSGAAVASANLFATASAPQLIYSPAVQSTLGSGFAMPSGVAVDGSGDLFVADAGNHAVKEIVRSGGVYGTPVALGSGFNIPTAIALDGSGNVYVADSGNHSVEEILRAGGYKDVITLTTNLVDPTGIAVDRSGNVYVADKGSDLVQEIVAVAGTVPAAPAIGTLGSGFSSPEGVAIDVSGNVFVADTGNDAVKEVVAVGGAVPASPTINTLGSGFSSPTGVALDAEGNLYVSEPSSGAVKKILAGAYTTVSTLAATLSQPMGVAVDGAGNIYLTDADPAKSQVLKLDYADAPSLSFQSTLTGSPGSDSPQTVTLTNFGNQPLTWSVPASGTNPAITSGFTLDTSSSCPHLDAGSAAATLGAGDSCTEAISFSPVAAGTISGSLTLTDTDLNAAGSTQTISLSGTAQLHPLAFAAISQETYGAAPFKVSAASSSAGAISYSVVSGPATVGASTGVVTLTGAGTLVLQASQAAAGNYGAATVQTTLTIGREAAITTVNVNDALLAPSQSVTLTAKVAPYAVGTPTGTVTFLDGTTALAAPVALTGGSAKLILSSLKMGSHVITAVYSGDKNFLESSAPLATAITVAPLDFTFAVSGPESRTINPGASAAFTFTLAPTNGVYPGAVTFSATGLPPGAAWKSSVSSVASGAGPQTVTITIQTVSAATAALHSLRTIGRGLAPVAFALLMPLFGLRRMRHSGRKLSNFLAALMIIALGSLAAATLSGCGTNTITNVGSNQAFGITVTATSSTMKHSEAVVLNIQ